MLRAQNLLEEALQSDFSPVASLFDVGENAVEVAHLCSELLHLAEALLHAFQPVADLLERGLHPLFQGLGELLVHGGAHPFELFLVVIAHLFQLRLHLAAHTVHVDGELLAHLGKLRLQVRAHFDDPRLEVGLQRLEILGKSGVRLLGARLFVRGELRHRPAQAFRDGVGLLLRAFEILREQIVHRD